MLKHHRLWLGALVLVLLVTTGCSKFRKIQKNPDWKIRYDAAVKYYERGERGDYLKAAVLFEELLPLIRGTAEAEKAQFYFAYSQFHQRLFIQSAYHFKSFYETYSRSEFAQESMYMHAYSLFLDSPVQELDQTSSIEAVQAMQNFINKFPDSEYNEQASNTIDELQKKLELKAYSNAKLYGKVRQYNSAVIAFENFYKDFPDSKLNEEIFYLQIEAQHNYAKASIYTKQKERYQKTLEYYLAFLEKYPESKYLKEAQKFYSNSLDFIEDLNRNEQNLGLK